MMPLRAGRLATRLLLCGLAAWPPAAAQYTTPADVDFPYLGIQSDLSLPAPYATACDLPCIFDGSKNAKAVKLSSDTLPPGDVLASVDLELKAASETADGEVPLLSLGKVSGTHTLRLSLAFGRLALVSSSGTVSAGGSRLDDGAMHHIAMVFEPTVLTIFVDGLLDRKASLTSSLELMDDDENLLGGAPGTDVLFVGTIRGVRFYDPRARRSASDVAVQKSLSHDPTKCREYTIWSYDKDCDGERYQTWCADGYQQISNGTVDIGTGIGGWHCVAPTRAAAIAYSTQCKEPCTFDGSPHTEWSLPHEVVLSGNAARSITFWLKTEVAFETVFLAIGDHAQAARVGVENFTGAFSFGLRKGVVGLVGLHDDITDRTKVNGGDWHHVAAVYDAYNEEINFYVDGERDAKLYVPRALDTPGNATSLLAPWLFGSKTFVGQLREINFFDYVLTKTQVLTLMFAPRESGFLWLEVPGLYAWADAADLCAREGYTLASYEDYCPHGSYGGQVPRGGAWSGNIWAPFAGDGDNAWVELGTERGMCATHGVRGRPASFQKDGRPMLHRPEWGVLRAEHGGKNGQVLCRRPPVLVTPLPEFGGGWELYLYVGSYWQHTAALEFGANRGGYGAVGPQAPVEGGHKMGEEEFDRRCFREVLAVGKDRRWARVVRRDGGCLRAADAFRVGTSPGHRVFMDGCEANSEDCNSTMAEDHGPFFCTCGGITTFMWARIQGVRDPWQGRRGTLPNAAGLAEGYSWAWYGRSEPEKPRNGVGVCGEVKASALDSNRSAGVRWMLYMFDGGDILCPRIADLRYGANKAGLGDLSALPTSGAHKMAERDFDEHRFTEILAQDGTGAWVKCSRSGGEPFTADIVFAVGISASLSVQCERSDGATGWKPISNPRGTAAGYESTYGPVFHGIWDDDDCQYHWNETCARGTIFGHNRNLNCSHRNVSHSWAWYGRSASSCRDNVAKHHALSFSGTERLMDEGTSLPVGNAAYTWEISLRPYSERGILVSAGPDGSASSTHFAQGGRLFHQWPGSSLGTPNALELNRWAQVAVTWDGTTRKIFVDGTLTISDTSTSQAAQAGPLVLGAQMQSAGCVESACMAGGLFDANCCANSSIVSCLPGYVRSFGYANGCGESQGGTCCTEVRHGGGFHGELFEVRLWSTALAPSGLDSQPDPFAPPAGLLRWYRFDREDAAGQGSVKNWALHGPASAEVVSSSQGPRWVEATIADSPTCTTWAAGSGTSTAFRFSGGASWDNYGGGVVLTAPLRATDAVHQSLLNISTTDMTLRFRWSYVIGHACLDPRDAACAAGESLPSIELHLNGMRTWTISLDSTVDDYPFPCPGGDPCPFSHEREETVDVGKFNGSVSVQWRFVSTRRNLYFRLHSMRLCQEPMSVSRRLAALNGGGWQLVRHCPAGQRWHKADDGLRGSARYGQPSDGDGATAPEWSIPFGNLHFDEFLFASGDGTRWLIAKRNHVLESYGLNVPRHVVMSSATRVTHVMPRRAVESVGLGNSDARGPLTIGLEDFADATHFTSDDLLLYMDSHASTWHGTNSTSMLQAHGGANVFIRDSRAKGRVSCEAILASYAVWGKAARGVDLGTQTAGKLKWIGCVDGDTGSCEAASFFCNDLTDGLEFGTSTTPALDGSTALRTLLGASVPSSSPGCCSNSTPSGVCNAMTRDVDVQLLCGQLGYNSGVVLQTGGNSTCPDVLYAGVWTSTFAIPGAARGNYASRIRCYDATLHPPTRLVHVRSGKGLGPTMSNGGMSAAVFVPTSRISDQHWWRLEEWSGKYRLVDIASGARLYARNNSELMYFRVKHLRGNNFGDSTDDEWWQLDRRGDKYTIVSAKYQSRLRVHEEYGLGVVASTEDFNDDEYWMFQPDPWMGPPCVDLVTSHAGWVTSGNVYSLTGDSASRSYNAAYLDAGLFWDGTLKVRVNMHGSNGSAGVLMRASAPHGTFYACRLTVGVAGVQLVRASAADAGVNGGQILSGRFPPEDAAPTTANTEVLLEMRIREGVNIECLKDGVLMASSADLSFRYGSYGIFTSWTPARFTILAADGMQCDGKSAGRKHWMVTPDVRANCVGIGGTMPASRAECMQAAQYLSMGFLELADSVALLHEGPSCGLVYGVVRWNRYGNSTSSFGPPWRGICQLNDFTLGVIEDSAQQRFVDTGERHTHGSCAVACAALGMEMPCLMNSWYEADMLHLYPGAWLVNRRPAGSGQSWSSNCSGGFTNWGALEPGIGDEERCAVLQPDGWEAVSCLQNQRCVCQTSGLSANAAAAAANDPFAMFCDVSPCHFDGTEAVVRRLPDVAVVEGDLPRSIVFLVMTAHQGGDDSFVVALGMNSTANAFAIRVRDGQLGLTTWANDVEPGGTSIGDGIWHHVAVTYASQNVSFFIDGVLDRTVTLPSSLHTVNSGSNYVGRAINPEGFFQGEVQGLGFYTVALPAERVAAMSTTLITPAPTMTTPAPTPPQLPGYSLMARDVECKKTKWLNTFSPTPAECAVTVESRVDCSLHYFVHELYGEGDCGCVEEGYDCRMEVHRKQNNLANVYIFRAIDRVFDRQSCNPVQWLNQYFSNAADCGALIENFTETCSQVFFLHQTQGDGNCGCISPGTDCLDASNRASTADDFLTTIYGLRALPEQPSPVPTIAPTPAPSPPPTIAPTLARCDSFGCPQYYLLKPNPGQIIGNEAEICCDHSCGDFDCPALFGRVSGSETVVGDNASTCCVLLPTPAPTVSPTLAPSAQPTPAPTAEPTPAPPTQAPTPPPTVAPTVGPPTLAPTAPIHDPIGAGYCRDKACHNRASCGHSWNTTSRCADYHECEKECYESAYCRGFAWSKRPFDNLDRCRDKEEPRCVIYLGSEEVTKTKTVNQEYSCYRSTRPSSVSLVLTLENLDYEVVAGDEYLVGNLTKSIVEAVVLMAGGLFGPDDVEVHLSAGSIVASVVVIPQNASSLGAVKMAVGSNRTELAAKVFDRVSKIHGISAAVTNGTISVRPAPPSTVDLVSTPATPKPTAAPTAKVDPPSPAPTPAPTFAPTVEPGVGLPLIIGVSVGPVGVIGIVVLCCWYCRRRRRKKRSKVVPDLEESDLLALTSPQANRVRVSEVGPHRLKSPDTALSRRSQIAPRLGSQHEGSPPSRRGSPLNSSPSMIADVSAADTTAAADEEEERQRQVALARGRARAVAARQGARPTSATDQPPAPPAEEAYQLQVTSRPASPESPKSPSIGSPRRTSMASDDNFGDELTNYVPRHWKNQDPKEDFMEWHDAEKPEYDEIATVVKKAFRHKDPHKPARLSVSAVHRVESADLWRQYCEFRKGVMKKRKECTPLDNVASRPLDLDWTNWPVDMTYDLEGSVNEVYLMAGCSAKMAAQLTEKGVWKLRRQRGVLAPYGGGFYMAENSAKADEAGIVEDKGAAQGYCCILICRVTLGEPYRTVDGKETLKNVADALATGRYDSVFGDPDEPPSGISPFRELVAIKPAQVYPAYVVFYKRRSAPVHLGKKA